MAAFALFAAVLLGGAAAAPVADAQLGSLGGLFGVVRISGTVLCSVNATAAAAAAALPFPNASVQLRCGGAVVSGATTDGSGAFSILLDAVTTVVGSLLKNCTLVVNTPLASCDAALPSTGLLQSPLSLVGTALRGLLGVADVAPAGFARVP